MKDQEKQLFESYIRWRYGDNLLAIRTDSEIPVVLVGDSEQNVMVQLVDDDERRV